MRKGERFFRRNVVALNLRNWFCSGLELSLNFLEPEHAQNRESILLRKRPYGPVIKTKTKS